MIALPCLVRVALAALGGFVLGLALGLYKVRGLHADVAAWRQLAADQHDENSRLRLSALVPPRPRRQP